MKPLFPSTSSRLHRCARYRRGRYGHHNDSVEPSCPSPGGAPLSVCRGLARVWLPQIPRITALLTTRRFATRQIARSLVLVFLSVNIGASQEDSASTTRWYSYVSAGYAYAAPSIVREYYDLIVASYQAEGVPISTQTPFGRTIGGSAGVLYSRLKSISVGFSVAYWYSPAYSNYQDYAGTLKVNGSVSSLELSLKILHRFAMIGEFPLNVSVQPGIASSSASIIQDLQFLDSPDLMYHSKWSASKWGPCFQATLGTSLKLTQFTVALEVGYKFVWTIVSESTVESTAGNRMMHEPWNIGQEGVVVLASIGRNF